jgi:proton-dependent oligopeptide transporter, POT family
MSEIAEPAPAHLVSRPRTFFGEPIGLAYLAFTECWERFSYYGMTSLLVLYMTQQLLLPGHVDHIAGFPTFRHGVEAIFGKLSTLALASQINGIYTGFVYFTPVFGGWIADTWIGRRNAVVLGAILMSAGHIAMAFDQSFLLALVLLIVGCGFLKGNISAQVGALYAENDGPGRTRGFSIFSMGINVGAVAGPIACGFLGVEYGWHLGFGLAGILMLLALATYLAGYRTLTEQMQASKPAVAVSTQIDREQQVKIAALFVVMALTIFHSIAFYQNTGIGLVWIDQHVDLQLFGGRFPVPWFSAINSFISIIAVPPLFAMWRYQAAHRGEPNEIVKIAIGASICCVSNLFLVAGALMGTRSSIVFPLLYNALLGVGFLYYWPTLLALVSRIAPPSLKSTLMGFVFLTLFVSNITLGWLGSFYERMGPVDFWLMNAAIAATGAALPMILRKPLGRILGLSGHEARVETAHV